MKANSQNIDAGTTKRQQEAQRLRSCLYGNSTVPNGSGQSLSSNCSVQGKGEGEPTDARPEEAAPGGTSVWGNLGQLAHSHAFGMALTARRKSMRP